MRTHRVSRDTLIHAVHLAIECQEKLEKEKFEYDNPSLFLQRLRELQQALLKRSLKVEIV